ETIDRLIERIEEAYATLSDPSKRSAYDRPAGVPQPRSTTKAASASAHSTAAHNSSDVQYASATKIRPSLPIRPRDPLMMADEHYRRGRARFERNDYHSAVHLFREAARLDPSRARHHYYLGLTLSVLAQARQFRHSHTHDVGCHVTCKL